MLADLFFRSASVFSVNSLILSGFPLIFFSFSRSLSICFFLALYYCVQLSRNITKCLLFIIIHIFSIYSFYNQPVLFAQLENVNKLWNNNRTEHVNERNQNKNKTKSRHIQIDHAFYYSILSENNVMVSLKDGFTA